MDLLLLCCILAGGAPSVETRFHQVHPAAKDKMTLASLERIGPMERTPGRTRAVLLVHGIRLHPISNTRVYEPQFHDWQLPGSLLIKSLGRDADVFAYAYGQNTRLETLAAAPSLAQAVGRLRFLGYSEIVLVGHSAGGVMIRLFVEDTPRCGVSKVIQICAPNDGSSWARLNFSVVKDQELLLQSLTRKERLLRNELRAEKRIPADIDFVCVVGGSGSLGDGLIACNSQWPVDLQKQGIPAIRLNTTHLTVMRSPKTVEKIVELVRESHPRWSEDKVQQMRKSILTQWSVVSGP